MPPKDTLNTNYLKFKESLPENLRLTPEKDYHMYDYWRLSGEPENFTEGKQRGMFTWDKSDKGYHAGSIAEDRNTGIYHFMKPKHHPTVKYELDWFNKGLQTLEGGKQVPVEGKDKEFWEDFTSKYQLDTTGVDYRYVPIKKKGGNIHIKKKNRGKFTDYCGGKVTQECIARGKKSKDPKIRKRATFAANVRKWKHSNGGILKYQNPSSPLLIPVGSMYGGELEPAVIKPEPIKAELNTYYPIVSKDYPWTGHSELILHHAGPQKSSVIVSKGGHNPDYNLVTNNCSDATRCAVEQIYGEKINPFLFTTPGDVRDFLLKKGIDRVKTKKGMQTQYFEIPFATAMDLRNQEIDRQIEEYKYKASKYKEKEMREHPKWNPAAFDESTQRVIDEYNSRKYVFRPFLK